MGKPTSIKIVKGIIIFKLILFLLFLIWIIILSSNSYLRGVLTETLGIVNFDAYNMSSFITEYIGVPLILVILSLKFLNKGRYKSLMVIFIIQLILSKSNILAVLIILIQLLIIIFDSSAKNYFKQINS